MALKPGTVAPTFEIPHHLDGVARLKDYTGKTLIVAFHPFSFTGGWTNQLRGFRDYGETFLKDGIEIIEISCDSIPTQKAWANSLGGVSFPIGSDFHPHGFISRQFDVYNKDTGAARRSVFIINGNGTIIWSKEYEPGTLPDPDELKIEIKKIDRQKN